ncbi:hypothetical protein C4D60_Mb03t04550 [Musa balbisiana]|uniref:Protein HEADING DATE REPRESSOR 1 n=1 Tax=Musa balbisiana TaxID=52838 RepID=A0A4V4H5V9_MUSBA|nr:hypothetical protein C4D60_Mb03t04550 [Musa balbisiana]
MDRAAITASNDPFAFSPPHLYRPLTFTSRKTTRGKPSKIETNKAREIERERGKGKQKRVLLLLVFLVGISSFQREFYCTQKRRREQAVMMEGFSPASPPRIFWNSRKRSATARSLEDAAVRAVAGAKEPGETAKAHPAAADEHRPEEEEKVGKAALSERRQALFEPLEPSSYGRRTPADVLLPPPDFDPTCYPKGWLVGKKRKLVNVDVVESMRRIAIQEMNRKDKEIDGLNEQLEEDARCMEHLQVQLLEERSKRVEAERQNAMLQDQVSMLMNVLEETQAVEEEASGDH